MVLVLLCPYATYKFVHWASDGGGHDDLHRTGVAGMAVAAGAAKTAGSLAMQASTGTRSAGAEQGPRRGQRRCRLRYQPHRRKPEQGGHRRRTSEAADPLPVRRGPERLWRQGPRPDPAPRHPRADHTACRQRSRRLRGRSLRPSARWRVDSGQQFDPRRCRSARRSRRTTAALHRSVGDRLPDSDELGLPQPAAVRVLIHNHPGGGLHPSSPPPSPEHPKTESGHDLQKSAPRLPPLPARSHCLEPPCLTTPRPKPPRPP